MMFKQLWKRPHQSNQSKPQSGIGGVCVICHMGSTLNPTLISYFRAHLSHIDVYFTVHHEVSAHISALTQLSCTQEIYECENRGMDILPFLQVLKQVRPKYTKVLKIHNKSDPHILKEICEGLCGSALRVDTCLRLLNARDVVGLSSFFISHRRNECCERYRNFDCYRSNQDNMRKVHELVWHKPFPGNKPFFAITMFWARTALFQAHVDALSVLYPHFSPGRPAADGKMEHAMERMLTYKSSDAMVRLPPGNLLQSQNIRIAAIHFPQFHCFEENDRFWGKGFTEWTLLKQTPGLSKDPALSCRLPRDGFYTLTESAVRRRQGDMAKGAGVNCFVFYHYWFGRRKVMYEPLEKMLTDGFPAIDFFLSWANEPWTKRWDGGDAQVLLAQDYGTRDDWDHHFWYLAQFFKHPRYVKLHNRPVFVIYRIDHMHAIIHDMLQRWTQLAKTIGFAGLHVTATINNFSPNITEIKKATPLIDDAFLFCPTALSIPAQKTVLGPSGATWDDSTHRLHKYDLEKAWLLAKTWKARGARHPGTFPSWNNFPRRMHSGDVTSFGLCQPQAWGMHVYDLLVDLVVDALITSDPGRFVFINAWNEWNEQAVLEPDTTYGSKHLDALREAIAKCSR